MICTLCHTEKPETDFYLRGKNRPGRFAHCKVCFNATGKRHYEKNRDRYRERNRRARRRNHDWYRSMKERRCANGCADCGIVYPSFIMEFDHRPGVEKVACVSHMKDYGRRSILTEIEKCDLVCANCHRIRTHERRNAPTTLT